MFSIAGMCAFSRLSMWFSMADMYIWVYMRIVDGLYGDSRRFTWELQKVYIGVLEGLYANYARFIWEL